MQGVFVSYRREDSAGHTGRLFDRLSEHFGRDRVFMDISDIEPGVDFVETIEKELTRCGVLLVVIGNSWSSCVDDRGRRRLDDPNDFIRLETATCLRRNIRVIPVLVQGARMPDADELPEELQGLTRRQAIEVSDTRWDYDTRKLIDTLERILPGEEITPEAPPPPPPETPGPGEKKTGNWMKFALLALAIAIGAVVSVYWFQRPEQVVSAKVPDLVGQAVGNAKWQIEKAGFTMGAVRAERTDKVKAGTVMSQDPGPGAAAERGAAIALVVAEEPETEAIWIPDLIGEPLKSAVVQLEKLGLESRIERKLVFSKKENQVVLAQKPTAGARVKPASGVSLQVGMLVKTRTSGGLELKQTWNLDLDSGKMGSSGSEDLWFHALTAKERYLEPRNGAVMAFFAGKPPASPPEICTRTKMSTQRIPIDKISRGSSLCVLTSEERYAFIQFLDAERDSPGILKMKYATWEKF